MPGGASLLLRLPHAQLQARSGEVQGGGRRVVGGSGTGSPSSLLSHILLNAAWLVIKAKHDVIEAKHDVICLLQFATRLTARAKPPLTQWAPPTGSSAPAPYPHLLARTTAPPAVRPLHLSHCPSRKPGVHKRPAHQQLPPPAQAGPLRNTAAATSRHAARPCSVMAARPLYQEAAGSPGSSPGMVTRWRLLHLGFIPKQC